MARKRATEDAPTPNELRVMRVRYRPGETHEQSLARVALNPATNNAVTIREIARSDFVAADLTALTDELETHCAAVSRGEMAKPEALLTAQAHTLDTLFNNLARLAYRNWDNLNAAERLLRLAFKAQTQSRATVETLGALRNPPVVFARQANIAHGPQQVNNGEPTRTREIESTPSGLLEAKDGERLDAGATSQGIPRDPAMATVGEIDRPANGGR